MRVCAHFKDTSGGNGVGRMKKIRVSVLGVSGYTAREALKILARHDGVEIAQLVSRSEPSPHVTQFHPELAGLVDKRCRTFDARSVAAESDVVLSCLPHKASFEYCGKLLDAGCRVVDLSADYRFQDQETYKHWYGVEHGDLEHLAEAVYGLPEINRDRNREARLVANPGCYPTAVTLAALPLVAKGMARRSIPLIAVAASGVSGAGRKIIEQFMFCSVHENVYAYKVGAHQHAPEMAATLSEVRGGRVEVLFTPYLVPMDRGILATVHVPLKDAPKNLTEHYTEFYRGEPFVRVLPPGEWPQTKYVWGTNVCAIGVTRVGDYAVAVSAIDNLIKGASGQAVHNLNIMFGLNETAGLK